MIRAGSLIDTRVSYFYQRNSLRALNTSSQKFLLGVVVLSSILANTRCFSLNAMLRTRVAYTALSVLLGASP